MKSLNEVQVSKAFIWTMFLEAPFWAMYALLVFILAKDLSVTPFQITFYVALKPVVSLFSPYWSSLIYKRPDRLRSNVAFANLIRHIPFFFFPFFSPPWFVIASAALFLMMKRGIVPAWMEILKRNVPEGNREKIFSYGSMISFFVAALLGVMLDKVPGCWRILFPITSLLSLASTSFLMRLPAEIPPQNMEPTGIKNFLVQPWKNCWNLLKNRPDFLRYQIGFMLGGSGLMIMHRALPVFVGELNLSYTTIAIAVATFKGIGFISTSRTWAALMKRIGIYSLSARVSALAFLFPFFLLAAKIQVFWIYIAYFIYGMMQAGSELSWHISGPLFSKNEDSSSYSSTNVIAVGIRGLFAPIFGAILCERVNPSGTLLLGGVFCLIASIQLFFFGKRSQQAA